MGSNPYHRISFTHMSSRRKAMLIYSKYDHVTIWQIYSQKHCRHRYSRNWYIKLECAASEILQTKSGVYLIMEKRVLGRSTHCTFFLSSKFFSYWIFLGKVLTRQCYTLTRCIWICSLFFLSSDFILLGFTGKVFNEAYS